MNPDAIKTYSVDELPSPTPGTQYAGYYRMAHDPMHRHAQRVTQPEIHLMRVASVEPCSELLGAACYQFKLCTGRSLFELQSKGYLEPWCRSVVQCSRAREDQIVRGFLRSPGWPQFKSMIISGAQKDIGTKLDLLHSPLFKRYPLLMHKLRLFAMEGQIPAGSIGSNEVLEVMGTRIGQSSSSTPKSGHALPVTLAL